MPKRTPFWPKLEPREKKEVTTTPGIHRIKMAKKYPILATKGTRGGPAAFSFLVGAGGLVREGRPTSRLSLRGPPSSPAAPFFSGGPPLPPKLSL